ncbi:MAG: amidohydrolase [Anaeroplasmataceae bacterium]|nr:amidohydrolase [Anaeroplasmataceae bacterium]MDE6414660.1 amidohydrolase [Anaeroplasmataceae bacterium]
MSVKEFRMNLHTIPEIGKCELKTKEYILNQLRSLSCKIYEPTPTGLVAYFNAHRDKTICFRADMDGLKITEKTDLPFSSIHPGYMHACGHDGHMAMLLEFALWADQHMPELKYNVVCLFQPSEEEHAGALDILNSGILDQLQVEEIYGIHIWPQLKKNQLFTMTGGLLASSSELNIEFLGKGVHAANRSKGIDALKIASSFLLECYQEFDKIKGKHLLSFGTMHSGSARNIVSDYAKLEATIRNFEDNVFLEMKEILYKLKQKYEKETNIRIQITIDDLYKSVMNDFSLISKYKDLLQVELLVSPFMQAEDFGCYTRKYKSMFMLLGSGDKHLLHTDTFDFDMDILATGVEAYKTIATN